MKWCELNYQRNWCKKTLDTDGVVVFAAATSPRCKVLRLIMRFQFKWIIVDFDYVKRGRLFWLININILMFLLFLSQMCIITLWWDLTVNRPTGCKLRFQNRLKSSWREEDASHTVEFTPITSSENNFRDKSLTTIAMRWCSNLHGFVCPWNVI